MEAERVLAADQIGLKNFSDKIMEIVELCVQTSGLLSEPHQIFF